MARFTTVPGSHFHGLSQQIVDWVLKQAAENNSAVDWKVGSADAPFAIATVTLVPSLGSVPCDLRGPIMGDPPFTEKDTWHQHRPGVEARTWTSRICSLPPISCMQVTVIAHAGGVITMFGGPLSPQEVGDPGVFDLADSTKFWDQHALSSESLTREEG